MRHAFPIVLASSLGFSVFPALGCGGPWDVACNVGKTVEKAANDGARETSHAVQDVIDTHRKAFEDIKKTGDKAAADTANAAEKALDDTKRTVDKSLNDAYNSTRKAINDAAREYSKAANDIIDAEKAAERFVENEIRSEGQVLSSAERRFRQGKVVDALWGLGADKLQYTNKNAAEAAQESEVLNAAAQAAATTYGGPAGAAAYAAWYAYNATKDVGLAFRAAALAAISSEAGTAVSKMPSGTVSEVVKKAAATGAMGGIAVAASGGDANAVRDGFVKAGSMVVVQSGQAYVHKNYIDPATSRADTYCMSAVGATCQYSLPKLKRDATNAFLRDADGKLIVDTSIVLDRKKDIGDWQEKNLGMDVVGSTESVLTANKDWAISFSKVNFVDKSSNIPAVVVTYIGQGSYINEKGSEFISKANSPPAEKNTEDNLPPAARRLDDRRWVSFEDILTGEDFFEQTSKLKSYKSSNIGDTLRSLRDLKLYARPAKWDSATDTLRKGSVVIISSVQMLSDKDGHVQKWIELESSGKDRGLDERPLIVPVPAIKTMDRIWCVFHQIEAAFEIDQKMNLKPLTNQIAGRAKRGNDGTISISLTKSGDVIPELFETSYSLIINKKGRLLQKQSQGTAVPVGICSSISEYSMNQ